MTALRIGVLVDQAFKRQYLGLSVTRAGHQVVYAKVVGVDALSAETMDEVDAWIIDVAIACDDGPNDHAHRLESVLSLASVPVIVSDSSEYQPGGDEHNAWLRRIMVKLRQLSGDINLQTSPRAKEVWVLAASTGGLAAVKEFLSALPANLGVAFVYVQHIESAYGDTLVKMMSNRAYPATQATQGAVLKENALFVVTAQERVEVMENGTLALSSDPWSGPYAPSADQLVADVARVYGSKAGLIVFSGMGDDGASAGRLLKQRGGRVWAQAPSTCTSCSMPEAALATGCVSYTGTPVQLAQRLLACRDESTPLMNA